MMETVSKITVNILIFLFMFISITGTMNSFFGGSKKIVELQSKPKTQETSDQILVYKLVQVLEIIFFVGAIATCLRLFGAI